MKILFVISCLSYGGAEKILLTLADNLLLKGIKCSIFNLNYLPKVQKVSKHIIVYDCPKFNTKIIKRYQQLKLLLKIIETEKPDLIISFLTMPNFLSVLAGKIKKIPVIISERGDPSKLKGFANKIIKFVINRANGAVFQTEYAKKYYSKKLQKKSVIIPNPIYIDNYISADYDNAEKSISHVGRFEIKQKRQDLMIKAFEIVNKKFPDYILKFYGDGDDLEKIRNMSNDYGLNNSIEFCGKVDYPIKYIKNSKLFILSSDYEGIPNALLEAMAIGLPVISTDYSPGGVKDIINNGDNGLIVECNNYIAIAEAAIKYITESNYAKKCGVNAKSITKKYNINNIIKLWYEYISKILKTK